MPNPSLLLSVLALALLAACGRGTDSDAAGDAAPSLVGTSWVLVEPELEGTQPIRLAFGKDGQVSGFAGVNLFRGPFQQIGAGNLTLGPLAATKMAGPPPAMQAEQEVLALLETVRTYRVKQGQLELLAARKVVLTLRRAE
jgi:heat shock protein HslJ